MAGSNAVGRGVPRRLLQGDGPTVPVIGAGQIPTIQFSTGNAKALQQFSRDLFTMSDRFEDQLDEEAKAQGQTAGAIAGASGNFELQTYGTIRGRAFNKAAVETFASTLDTQAAVKLNELSNKYWNDPDGLNREWTNYRNGVASELTKTSPEQAVAFQNRNTIRGMTAIEQSKDTAFKMVRSEADAAIINNEASLRAEIKANALDLFSENPDRSRAASNAIGQVQRQFMNIYNAVDTQTGKPLYSPEEKAKAQKWLRDTTVSQATLSWFDEQPDKAGAYLKFASGDFKFNISQNNNQVPIIKQNFGKRNLPIAEPIANQIKAAAAATGIEGVQVVVTSGGQSSLEEFRNGTAKSNGYTGSTRHVHGGAGDVKLAVGGKILDFATNRDAYLKFAENAAAAGLTGIGVDEAKGYLHLGGGSKAEWGYKGGANGRQYLADDFAQAIERGRGQKLDYEPKNTQLSVMQTLSPTALDHLDSEMRQRISFTNSQIDRKRQADEKALGLLQDKNAYELTVGIFSNGQQDPTTGKPFAVPTRGDITEMVRAGRIKSGDGERLVKALATERPEVSDHEVVRKIENAIYNGEDQYSAILEAGSKISSKDAGRLLGINRSVVREKQGDFNSDQKYYFDTLNTRLGQTGLFDKFDQGKADRKAQALDEYRRRVLDKENPESPSAISDDIAARATADYIQMDQSKLGRMVMPRFSVPIEGRNRLDIGKSKEALIAAKNAGSISPDQFLIEADRLVKWSKLQQQIDSAPPPSSRGKGK